jgi:hypothetical protein
VKEKFSKLLLGEDMSGTGKGVSSALALSNAITNLAGIPFSLSLSWILPLFFGNEWILPIVSLLFSEKNRFLSFRDSTI